jgi:hypothetical protein
MGFVHDAKLYGVFSVEEMLFFTSAYPKPLAITNLCLCTTATDIPGIFHFFPNYWIFCSKALRDFSFILFNSFSTLSFVPEHPEFRIKPHPRIIDKDMTANM